MSQWNQVLVQNPPTMKVDYFIKGQNPDDKESADQA